MIADRTSGVKSTSTMGGESFQAGIDDENMAHIIGLFTDLYSDTELAVIREYSTNARDAQIEAGIIAPINVTLPSALSSFFTVTDTGVGMDKQTIAKVYSRYGTSTKRGTNAQNGMLGLGCKSALTYAQQFTVESVKDGVKTICSVTRVDNGVPSFQVISETPSDQPNGTKVSVPARRGNQFAQKAAALYRFWPEDSVLVDGEEPTRIKGLDLGRQQTLVEWGQHSMQVDVHLIVADREEYLRGDTVVMGGVAYPAPHLETGLPYGRHLVAEVSIGAVDFTPSRESLMTTPKTQATLATLGDSLLKAAQVAIQKEVDASDSPRAALKVLTTWRDLIKGNVQVKYKGTEVPESLDGKFTIATYNSYKLNAHGNYNGCPVETAAGALFVVGYAPTTYTSSHKKKLVQYVDEQIEADALTARPTSFVLTALTTLDMTWIDPAQVIQWDEVRKVKLPRAVGTRSGRPTGSYDGWVAGSNAHIHAEDIDEDEELFYFRGPRYAASDMHKLLVRSYPDCTFVLLPENRLNKFVRNFPEAIQASTAIKALYTAWEANITEDQRKGLGIVEQGMLDKLQGLDETKIDDPAIVDSIRIAKAADLTDLLSTRTMYRDVLHSVPTATPWVDPLTPYGLLGDDGYYKYENLGHEHQYIYMNAVYAARNA